MAFVFGLITGFIISFLYGKKIIKQAVADAETRGIHQGATLEAEIGWTKKKKVKKR